MIVFGVGCIYFGRVVEQQVGKQFDLGHAEFIKEISEKLGGLENISNIRFDGIADLKYGGNRLISESAKSIIVPIPQGGVRISFDIYLPFRIQEQIIERCDVESIHVDIHYAYDFPIAILSYDWPEEEGDAEPSMAVAVVRKYLQSKLSDNKFVCGSLGPSPFHANFTVIDTELDSGVNIIDRSIGRMGYASIEITAPPSYSLSSVIIQSNLEEYFSLFYKLSELRVRALSAQESMVNSSRELLSGNKVSGIVNRVRRWRDQAGLVDAINNDVYENLLTKLSMGSALSEGEGYDLIGPESTMERFMIEYRQMVSEEAWSKFTELANFFEERRQKLIGNAATLIAGVIGGVIGSIIGSLATYALTTGR